MVRVLVASVVVLFVGAIFAPGFYPHRCRSQQSEAKGNLKALYVAEESYRAEFDVYSLDTSVIGFVAKGAKVRYRYVVTDVTDVDADPANPRHTFRAWAFRVDGERDDLWTISEQNDLTNLVNGCEQ